MYRRKLKNNVKNEFIRDGRDYEDLKKFIKITIEFDDKLYERVMKRRYDQSKNKAELIYESTAEDVKAKKSTSYIRNSEYTELAFMKLNITQRRKGKNSKNKKKQRKEVVLRM